ncbi:MAG: phosphate ABC transporter permease subunit PstC [Methylobacterium mesophilicum]|nr:phosphate ABC transporter permease subunit PstC [Methylobacterium mesophilicum]
MTAAVFGLIILIGAIGFVIGRSRAARESTAGGKLHSLPHYHGWWAFLLAVVPAILFLLAWDVGSSVYADRAMLAQVEARSGEDQSASPTLVGSLTRSLSTAFGRLDSATLDSLPATAAELKPVLARNGMNLADNVQDYMIPIAKEATARARNLYLAGAVVALIASIAGAVVGLSQVALRARARNRVERLLRYALLGASTIAIMTTVGIVLSMLFQTITFFSEVSPLGFFFGTVWDPRFAAAGSGGSTGQFGLIPLLAGTLYIALVALLVAVPIGLMAAVYMAEYAKPHVRSVVKPALELLAGIPTIVYGIFALITLGPWLRDLSAALTGGTPFIQAQSIFTAGLVMGIMLIPVVSSLSDDIITAVPKAMRDGSLGLGATRSETIKRVVLPAALPGIVGAVLLTASRAIGETMIVVLAAGVAANLTLNPFEAMTTITVKIVNQLTGDLEFNSPQTLVAFALGMTLFVVTLIMNIAALYIVRKYREQYE